MKLKADFMQSLKEEINREETTSAPVEQKFPERKLANLTDAAMKSAASIKKQVEDKVEYVDPNLVLPYHSDPAHPPVLNPNNLELLRPSVKEKGILAPATVRIDPDRKGSYELSLIHI